METQWYIIGLPGQLWTKAQKNKIIRSEKTLWGNVQGNETFLPQESLNKSFLSFLAPKYLIKLPMLRRNWMLEQPLDLLIARALGFLINFCDLRVATPCHFWHFPPNSYLERQRILLGVGSTLIMCLCSHS